MKLENIPGGHFLQLIEKYIKFNKLIKNNMPDGLLLKGII